MSDIPDIIDRLCDAAKEGEPPRRALLVSAAAEIERLRFAIRRLAEQDATLSVCDGNVTVTMDSTLTAEEREAIKRLGPSADPVASFRVILTPAERAVFHGLLERLGDKEEARMSDTDERSGASAGSVSGEPIAWGIACDGRLLASYTCEDEQSAREMAGRFEASRMTTVTVVPLYRSPTLTDAEREALERVSVAYDLLPTEGARQISATLRGLLERLGGER